MRQSGTTLLEVVVAAAIVIAIAASSFTLSQGLHFFAARSAVAQFDAAFAYAQTLAAQSGNGATLVFAPRHTPGGDIEPGFVLTVYSGRPDAAGALNPAPFPPLTSDAGVLESRLGAVPFTVFLDGAGHASAQMGAVAAQQIVASDPGCPAGEHAVSLTFSDPRALAVRTLPCNPAAAGQAAVLPAP